MVALSVASERGFVESGEGVPISHFRSTTMPGDEDDEDEEDEEESGDEVVKETKECGEGARLLCNDER